MNSLGGKHVTRDKTDGRLRHTRLANESTAYLARREELRLAELALIQQSERVAELRRACPWRPRFPTTNFLKVLGRWMPGTSPFAPCD